MKPLHRITSQLVCAILVASASILYSAETEEKKADQSAAAPIHYQSSSEFLKTFPLDKSDIDWNTETAQTITFRKGKLPFIMLVGIVGEGKSLELNYQPIEVDSERRFFIQLELTIEPHTQEIRIQDGKKNYSVAKFNYVWKKKPPLIRAKVKEKGAETTVERSGNFSGNFPSEEWIELRWADSKSGSEPGAEEPTKWFSHFQLNGIAALPTTGGNSLSPQLGWTPSWKLSDKLSVRLNLALSVFKYDAARKFLVWELGPLVGYSFGRFTVEVGPEAQNWVAYGGIHYGAAGNILYRLPKRKFFIEHIFAGYALHLLTNTFADSKAHEAKLGVGIAF